MEKDLIVVMQTAISLLDKGEASKANGVLKRALVREFNSGMFIDDEEWEKEMGR